MDVRRAYRLIDRPPRGRHVRTNTGRDSNQPGTASRRVALLSLAGVASESEQPAKDQCDQFVDIGGFEKNSIVTVV